MAYYDSDPERRNLVASALAIIIYFWAGGSVPEQLIKIQVINVSFSRTWVLAAFVWAALFWFLYRYWLKHRGEFITNFSEEILHLQYQNIVKTYVSSHLPSPIVKDSQEGFHIDKIYWKSWFFYADYKFAKKVGRNHGVGSISSITSQTADKHGTLKFEDKEGWVVALKATGACMFSMPSFSSIFIPYLLFLLALFSGVINLVL